MSTLHKPKRWKRWVRVALGALLALDAILLIANWRALSAAPREQAAERDRLAARARLLAADVAKGQAIEKRLPQVAKECDTFYQDDFLPASTGYADIIADFGAIAKTAGVRAGGVAFRQKEIKKRGITEVTITANIDGDYPGLIRFVNGLERSKNFYLLDGLALASETTGGIKLNLELRTYFRS